MHAERGDEFSARRALSLSSTPLTRLAHVHRFVKPCSFRRTRRFYSPRFLRFASFSCTSSCPPISFSLSLFFCHLLPTSRVPLVTFVIAPFCFNVSSSRCLGSSSFFPSFSISYIYTQQFFFLSLTLPLLISSKVTLFRFRVLRAILSRYVRIYTSKIPRR